MKLKFLFSFALLLSIPAHSGGGSSAGGGEGIVCFDSNETLQKAIVDGKLVDNYRDQISYVASFDAEENFVAIQPFKGEGAVPYLRRVAMLKLESHSEEFRTTLLTAINLITSNGSFANWIDRGSLPKMDDAGTRLQGTLEYGLTGKLNCGLVQLAIRHKYVGANGVINAWVDYDKDLVMRMLSTHKAQESRTELTATLHQAYLVLHEALYLIGAVRGHENSESARRLAGYLLAASTPIPTLSNEEKANQLNGLLKSLNFKK